MSKSGDFIAPLGAPLRAPDCGRLVFASGAAGAVIQADPALESVAGGFLAAGHFVHPVPQVRVSDETVTIQYPTFLFFDRPVTLGEPVARIRLNPSFPWEIEFRRGASQIRSDLRQVQLRSLDVLGGASQIVLWLSRPAGTTYIYIAGGASQVRVLRPPGVGAAIHVCGGATSLTLDDQHFGALRSDTRLESSDFRDTACRYDIRISGGASRVSIGRKI